MPWISVNYRPGFSYDLTSWRTEIELDGRLSQIVDVTRLSPPGRRTVEHQAQLSPEQVSELDLLASATDFAALEAASRRHAIDDAEQITIAVERCGTIRRFSAPLLWWSFAQRRGDLLLPELAPAVALWEAIDRVSPHRFGMS
jgi:hypothetical protein